MAATRAFAEHGVTNASLLDITRQAGQRNRGAVHYHFGSREGLLAAVLEQHPQVKQATVVSREDPGGSARLVAYVVPRAEPEAEAHRHRAAWPRLEAMLQDSEADSPLPPEPPGWDDADAWLRSVRLRAL